MADQAAQPAPPAQTVQAVQAPPPAPAAPATVKDPWIENLKASMGKVLDPSKSDATIETVTLPRSDTRTIGEQALYIQEIEEKKTAAEPVKPAEATPAAIVPPVVPPVAAPPKVEPAKVEVKAPRTQFVDPTPVPQRPQFKPLQDPAKSPPPAPQETDDEKFIKTLTDEEKDEYDLAVYASKQNETHSGKPAEVLGFFKKVQQFTITNPTADAESQEFKDFIDKNKPGWKPGERNKLNRRMIEETVTNRTKAELQPVIDQQNKQTQSKLREIEARPIVDKQVQRFTGEILGDRKAIGLPDEIEGISEAVIKDAATMTPAQLIATHPVEGPVVAQHLHATHEFERLVSGAVDFNPQDPNHSFLVKFLDQQEDHFSKLPDKAKNRADRLDEDGIPRDVKSWIPRQKMAEYLHTNPALAQRHWCFDDDQVRKMLAFNAHSAVQHRVDSLTKAGFVRPKIQKVESTTVPVPTPPTPQPPTPPAVPVAQHQSPKAGVSVAPGAAETSKTLTPGQRFIQERIPGYKMAQPA